MHRVSAPTGWGHGRPWQGCQDLIPLWIREFTFIGSPRGPTARLHKTPRSIPVRHLTARRTLDPQVLEVSCAAWSDGGEHTRPSRGPVYQCTSIRWWWKSVMPVESPYRLPPPLVEHFVAQSGFRSDPAVNTGQLVVLFVALTPRQLNPRPLCKGHRREGSGSSPSFVYGGSTKN